MLPDKPAQAVPPHPVLTGHYSAPEERVGYIRRLFDETASDYDRINNWMSLRTGERYRREVLLRTGLGPGQAVLDLACGTGVIAGHAQALTAPGGTVVALDPSLPMLAEAGRRGVELRAAGAAEALPLAERTLDLVVMGYALRHLADLRVGFAEMLRVLKPGGRLLILEMVPPRSPLGYALTKVYLKYLVPAVTATVARQRRSRRLMEYYWQTVDRCIPPETVLETLRQAGFASIERKIQFGLFNEYQGQRPQE